MSNETKIREAVEDILTEKEYEKHYLASRTEEVKKVIIELDGGEFLTIEG